ncbi:MAG: hypothetical protein H6822_09900 [Planctomycetaceae bacterium]|nr:hypothetical protein [Planctomycetales bacterium]MCB9922484.1 hypothetical protein [Planctomycetaceae bacterium]
MPSYLAVIFATQLLSAATANPQHQAPHETLDAHGICDGGNLHGTAKSLYASAIKETQSYLDAVAAGKGARLSGKALGQTRLKFVRLYRMAPQLEIQGESAGTDFLFRVREFGGALLYEVIKPYASAPTSQNFVDAIRLSIKKQTPARVKILEKLQRMVADQDWIAAEVELYRLFDALEPGVCFLSDPERLEIEKPFADVRAAIDAAMRRIRSQEAAQMLGQSRGEQTPDFASLSAAMQQAIGEVAANGSTDWDGEQVTGPQLVEKFGMRWAKVHVACLHCRALDWAMQPLFQMAGANATKISPDPTSETLQHDYLQFSSTVVESVAALIRADAERVSGDEVVPLYNAYLKSIAPLARQVANGEALQTWNAALQQLASKAPEFADEVAAYDAATRELLRWRARTAASLARSRSGEYQTLDKLLYDATVSKAPFVGLFPERPDSQLAPRLLASAPAIMTVATPRLMGKQATAFDVVRVSPTSSSAIARYRSRTYANVPAGLDLSSHVSALKDDLLVRDDLSALTLGAAISIHSSERGDLAAVGGDIAGHHLEAVITRFATLPDAASILVPLGVLPIEDIKQPLLPQMLMRFDITPSWVQHEHFFADLSAVQ